jgi:hypothetical protein
MLLQAYALLIVLSIEDRIKKLIGDIELLKDEEAALANGATAPAPVLISIGIFVFFLDDQTHGGVHAFNFSS